MISHENALNYAKGLFELSHELKTLEDLANVQQLVEDHPKLMRLLGTHDCCLEEKHRLLAAIFAGRLEPLLYRFLCYLVEKNSFSSISLITHEYRRLVMDKSGVLKATLVSPMPVSEAHQSKLGMKLSSFYQKKVEIDVQVKPEIIGGAILMIDNQMIDLTLSTQLNKLTKKLLAAQI